MMAQPHDPGRRAPRRRRMGKGCGPVRRRRAAAAGIGSRNIPCSIRMQGYRYCDLLLSQGRAAEARDRAAQTLEWARRQQLGSRHRARHSDPRPRPSRPGAAEPGERRFGRDGARRCARGCRQARRGRRRPARLGAKLNYVPRGLLARAAFRRAVGDWDGAARDLDEVAGDRRAGADAALSLRLRARARAARAWRGAKPSRR